MYIKIKTSIVFSFLLFCQISGFGKDGFDHSFRYEGILVHFRHSGNADTEKVELKDVVLLPYYAGPRRMDNPFSSYGDHRLLILNAEKDTVFIKPYSSLFFEWRFTEEALMNDRGFEQSLIIPCPNAVFYLVIESRNDNYEFEALSVSIIDPDTLTYSKMSSTYPYRYLIKNGNNADKVDVLFVPEGYSKKEKRKFKKDVKRFASYLGEYEPYPAYKKHFNILYLKAWSQESGTSKPFMNIRRNTLFQTSFNTLNTERYLMTEKVWALYQKLAHVPFDHIYIIVNDHEYGGGGIFNLYAIGTADNPNARFLFHHEFGHSFAGLADEYTSAALHECIYLPGVEPWQPNITTLVESKWEHLLSDVEIPTPLNQYPKDVIGAFEGAAYCERYVFRPRLDCSMRTVSEDNFCPVCKEAIIKMIEYFSHE